MGRNTVPQTNVRIPEQLKEQLRERAEREHWTMTTAIVEAIKLLLKTE